MIIRALRYRLPVLFVALLFSACNTATPVPSSTPTIPGASATTDPTPTIPITPTPVIDVTPSAMNGINLLVWDAFSGQTDDVFREQVAQFNAGNEWGITVIPTDFGDYTTLFDTVNISIDNGNSPDLVVTLPEQVLAWDASALVVDLTSYIEDPVWGLGSDWKNDFFPLFWNQDNVAGKQLGLPAQRSARFLFYNKTWAHELGFDSPPETADEFRQQACAANASFLLDKDLTNDGKGGYVVDSQWQTIYSWLLAFGGTVTEGTQYHFLTDENLTAMEFLKGLNTDFCAWPSETPFDSFAARSALFISSDLAEVAIVQDAISRLNNHDEWTLLPFPGPSGSTLVTYGTSYSLFKSTPERQLAAWLFTRWLVSPENQVQWVEETGLFPLLHSVMDTVIQSGTASPQWVAAVEALSQAQDVPQLASWRKVRYVLEDGSRMILQADQPVENLTSILAEMDSTAEEIIAK
jgi:multiple sugar transport system substrate-binding protein